ncbi:16S rRNA (guanine(966)-N(2))-methyltransferase RsmD [Mycoplasmopsis bovirhinis]|uniref:16S rRNA (guanine(966)-N(2))-methyltransferase RsmD n=1 Tax=Mycoplasmopsis bovirhinis TaxID=29553 RepID=UPI000C05C604|nr:16S rRNA (guanine(966)-N(2))-methyltransferase RsmD [Mycoplasmopsis bovirhinis]ATO30890.1 16S rRNA (guanine(966)-N(2))-methyltransferase RsmD [Mycoplasmopsis bovirhinis]
MLRIISGIYRNRKLAQPDLKITRPTTDKVREAIFSSLHFKLPGKTALDLFAGSGALAIESLSRGAIQVDAIEKHREAYKILNTNLNNLKIENLQTYHNDAIQFLNNTKKQYDFIFIDAPYQEYNLVNQALYLIIKNKLLQEEGEIILETDNLTKISLPSNLIIYKEKKYGKIFVAYLVKAN